jgi:hypothetical protein
LGGTVGSPLSPLPLRGNQGSPLKPPPLIIVFILLKVKMNNFLLPFIIMKN